MRVVGGFSSRGGRGATWTFAGRAGGPGIFNAWLPSLPPAGVGAEASLETMTHNAASRLVTSVEGAVVLTYTFDANGNQYPKPIAPPKPGRSPWDQYWQPSDRSPYGGGLGFPRKEYPPLLPYPFFDPGPNRLLVSCGNYCGRGRPGDTSKCAITEPATEKMYTTGCMPERNSELRCWFV